MRKDAKMSIVMVEAHKYLGMLSAKDIVGDNRV